MNKWLERVLDESELDPGLIDHVFTQDCQEPFCLQMKKLADYASQLRLSVAMRRK